MCTRLRTVSLCPSPSRIAAQGCLACAGSRLHILTVESSDAEARTWGLMGDTARSFTSYTRKLQNFIFLGG